MAKRIRTRLRELVRHFKENGIKLLLEHPLNVRELLLLLSVRWVKQIDFATLQLVKTTFIRRDFRHVESDIVLSAQLRPAGRKGSPRRLLIYLLIEHQSEPDRLMPLRLVDYVVQIFNYQLRQWSRSQKSLSNFHLQPVLPIVLYTGTRSWPSVGTLADLIERGQEFRDLTPIVEKPFFLNLTSLSESDFSKGRCFGSVLRLIQQRRAGTAEFEALLEQVIGHLESMPEADRLRWLDLVSYIHAMIYHERRPAEHGRLHRAIEASVATDTHRQELVQMGKTIADVIRDEGMKEGIKEGIKEGEIRSKRETLLRLLEARFGKPAADVHDVVESTTDIEQLDTWLERFATAKTLKQVGIQ